MADNRYRVTREDGEEFGTFDRRDEAERVAEYDAKTRGYGLRWVSTFGKKHGRPTTTGRDVLGYTIQNVPCE